MLKLRLSILLALMLAFYDISARVPGVSDNCVLLRSLVFGGPDSVSKFYRIEFKRRYQTEAGNRDLKMLTYNVHGCHNAHNKADAAPFAAAVAIAPVSDWRFYDTVYTERYMLTPQQNETGYNSSSALRRATSLTCPLLVMYGTLDDNVHPANSLQYVSALQSAGILCDMFVFPNMNHSINGCNARPVVYGRMFEFFSDRLK